ncbi:DNA adenine methylase [Natronorubrum aibiense]|uniref:site-specific DNA-methyltransferase (adenine-specific) n=1 Tax=Natronorubrum aibiense TaxID=348826 RepID=A0A5P9P8H5_9EURY|nr:Dam family site-specific DNA-(adenine-N6)-methyltransferase [Natronorubrum aibiense]QFU84287.1 Dam family site-specific DNA-(adenine-N6)-methyltransferase [Natronorubrum aibiense]
MAEPILRWAGGKRQYLDKILHHLPPKMEFDAYFEPFFGGGSVFFSLEPSNGYISDVNPRLMNFYSQIQNSPSQVISKNKELDREFEALVSQRQRTLDEYGDSNNMSKRELPDEPKSSETYRTEFYETKREEFNDLRNSNGECKDPLREAVLFLFLNRTCWNGLYRSNQEGDFNVPLGRQWTKIAFLENRIHEAHRVLSSTTISSGDFAQVLELPSQNDLVFLDPPYPAGPNEDGFQDYHPAGFGLDRQKELAEFALKLDSQGVYVMITNAPSEAVMNIYEETGVLDRFEIDRLEGSRMINSVSENRTDIGETDVILTNYDQTGSAGVFNF